MVERLPETFDSKVGWLDTKSGIRVREAFRNWYIKTHDGVDPVIAILTFEQRLEAMCDFFEDRHAELTLTKRGKIEAGKLWREASKFLEDKQSGIIAVDIKRVSQQQAAEKVTSPRIIS